MPIVRDNAMQSIFAVAHCVVILAGSMFVAAAPRVRRGEGPWEILMLRDWGFLLLLIPAAWVVGTIWLERHRSDWFTKRWTVLSGLLVLLSLVSLMIHAFSRASFG
ncbi:hypothetical protein OJ996_12270 [Luteolibacter sp. GHJ8]|uniref:Uncharacterized protein n=1 Tax=Luteolibacter rhizosphaerae TaxID=2989719 RepID=A0ABT3G4B1_9BACT|nr:hypothetical protein [Luteolibacter rhizosphaerae]MCW1914356.1 hypothetical protein [Luteolibacter rhizosphaerae]